MYVVLFFLYICVGITKSVKYMEKNLNPQAATYYKRLILVSDRYLQLRKGVKKLRYAIWILVSVILFLVAVIIKYVPELLPLKNLLF